MIQKGASPRQRNFGIFFDSPGSFPANENGLRKKRCFRGARLSIWIYMEKTYLPGLAVFLRLAGTEGGSSSSGGGGGSAWRISRSSASARWPREYF